MTEKLNTENEAGTKPLLCEVNESAYNTWLEPYIGWTFKIVKVTNKKVLFLMDYGFGKLRIQSYDKVCFNLT